MSNVQKSALEAALDELLNYIEACTGIKLHAVNGRALFKSILLKHFPPRPESEGLDAAALEIAEAIWKSLFVEKDSGGIIAYNLEEVQCIKSIILKRCTMLGENEVAVAVDTIKDAISLFWHHGEIERTKDEIDSNITCSNPIDELIDALGEEK